MKLTVQQYARLLFEAYETEDKIEQNKLVKGIAEIIRANGDFAKISEIENHYNLLKKKISKQLEGVVFTARKIDEKKLNTIRKVLAERKKVKSEQISLKNEIDESLKGGFVIDLENEILDGSLKGKLESLKEALVS